MPLGSLVRIALVQFTPQPAQREQNLLVASALCGQKKADVWLFPHLFSIGAEAAGVESFGRLAEDEDGPTPSFLKKLAMEKKAYAIGSYLAKNVKDKNKQSPPFVRSVAYNSDGIRVSSYDQIHLSSITGESLHLSPGERLPFFDCLTFRSAMISSYDLRFPELAREFGLSWGFFLFVQGAFRQEQIHQWDALLQARASENQMFVIGCNFSHSPDSSEENPFGGHSAVFDPAGKKQHQAGANDQVLILDIDPFQVEWNRNRHQYLTDSKMKLAHRFVFESEEDPDK